MKCDFAHVAQLVEHFLGKEEVTGSNPVMGSIVFSNAVMLVSGIDLEGMSDG